MQVRVLSKHGGLTNRIRSFGRVLQRMGVEDLRALEKTFDDVLLID